MAEHDIQPSRSDYPAIINVVGSPLKFFALSALICNAVYSLGAGMLGELEAFVYSIHMFLAIVGLFVLIAIFCPSMLYHPRGLENIREQMLPYHPVLATIAAVAVLILYMVYQYVIKQ